MIASSGVPGDRSSQCSFCKFGPLNEPAPGMLSGPCPECGQLPWGSTGVEPPLIDRVTRFLAQREHVRFPDDLHLPPKVVELVTASMAWENTVVPIGWIDYEVFIAVTDRCDIDTVDKLRFVLTRDLRFVVVDGEWIRRQIQQCYGDNELGGAL